MNAHTRKRARRSTLVPGAVAVPVFAAVLAVPLLTAVLLLGLLAGVISSSFGGGAAAGQPQALEVGAVSAEGWTHPIPGVVIYQGNYGQVRAGYIHAGEDLSAPYGTPIYAAAAGVVSRASCEGFQGRSPCNVIINHGTDASGQVIETWYVHMYPQGVLVSLGQQVAAGEQIALTGSNGNSTGPHLHLEVRVNGAGTDPTAFFAARGVDLRNPAATPPGAGGVAAALSWARTQIGAAYLWGGSGPSSYDCSGLTMRAYESAGLELPRTSRQQYAATVRISEGDLRPGDLVFWSSDATAEGIYHVALYAGDGQIVQAPSAGRTVEEVTLWRTNLYGFGRLP